MNSSHTHYVYVIVHIHTLHTLHIHLQYKEFIRQAY